MNNKKHIKTELEKIADEESRAKKIAGLAALAGLTGLFAAGYIFDIKGTTEEYTVAAGIPYLAWKVAAGLSFIGTDIGGNYLYHKSKSSIEGSVIQDMGVLFGAIALGFGAYLQ